MKQLKLAKSFLRSLDTDLRKNTEKCPRCGKPREGVVYHNQDDAAAGLCTCNLDPAPDTMPKDGSTPSQKATTADARLIAAAPDLLQACEAMLALCATLDPPGTSTYNPTMHQARAAVSKARGDQ